MDDDEDLFAGLGVAEITHSGHGSEDQQVDEAWKLWCDLTGRPDARHLDREFGKVYRKLLRANFTHAELLECIHGAARLPVRPRDPSDTRRVKMVLDSWDWTAAAKAALESDDPIIPYPRDEEVEPKSSFRDIEEACGITRVHWTSRDMDAAAIIIQELDPDEVEGTVRAVKLHTGEDVLLPCDILRGMHSARMGSVVANASRSTYDAGSKEQEDLEEVLFDADIAAERMHLRGAKPAEIIAFHNQAPEGYWDAVLDYMEGEPDASFDDIYDALHEEWGWHPSQRS